MSTEPRTQRYRTEDVQSDAGSFSDLLLPQPLVQALAGAGFVRPSPVQKAAIPIGRVGTDLIVQAKSGTGKTAVFATILLDRVDLEVSTPQAIVVAPTRELAIQSFQVIERVAAALPQPAPSAAVFVGGLPTADDAKRLRRVCHIAVGTPGRLCGLMTSGALLLGQIKAVVLDEADQLLSEAFYADTAWLLQQLPKRKQVLACSATYTPQLLADLEPLMRRPQKVLLCEETVSLLGIRQFYRLVGDVTPDSSAGSQAVAGTDSSPTTVPSSGAEAQETAAPASQQPLAAAEAPHTPAAAAAAAAGAVANGASQSSSRSAGPTAAAAAAAEEEGDRQKAAAAQPEPQLSIAEQQELLLLKVDALLQLLSSVSFHQAVVFCNRKPSAEWLARRLTAAGCPSAHLSSDLPQPERMAAMEAVRAFKVRLIVSTDVMARGVDFDRVNLVVNVDLPPDAATYVHRVGRTGRFGSRGIAVALLAQQELGRLQQYLADVKGGEICPLPEEIPSDLYSYDLGSDWERDAYKQLLAAPTTTPPDSPPPVRTRKPKQQQQQQQDAEDELQEYQQGGQGLAGGSAAAAAQLSAFGYDESGLSCFDWEDEDGDSQQQQQQQQQQGATARQPDPAAAAAGAMDGDQEGAYDPAAAWEAWAAYYRSLGYDYPHTNPYLQQQQQRQQQQEGAAGSVSAAEAVPGEGQTEGRQGGNDTQAPAAAAGTVGSSASVSGGGRPARQWQAQLPQHQVWCEVEEEVEEGWELPSEDEIDDRARALLSRLHVTQEAAALASGTAAAAPGPAAAADDDDDVRQARAHAGPASAAAAAAAAAASSLECQHQHLGGSQHVTAAAAGAAEHAGAAGGAVCWGCWAQRYETWQAQYAAWQQQFSAWCQQYQQQQGQQYSAWCAAYQQQLSQHSNQG